LWTGSIYIELLQPIEAGDSKFP